MSGSGESTPPYGSARELAGNSPVVGMTSSSRRQESFLLETELQFHLGFFLHLHPSQEARVQKERDFFPPPRDAAEEAAQNVRGV